MKFGKVPVRDAHGAILAHSLQTRAGILKKGRPLGNDEIAKLLDAGFEVVVAARIEPGDVSEDVAAAPRRASHRRGRRAGRGTIYRPRQSLRGGSGRCRRRERPHH